MEGTLPAPRAWSLQSLRRGMGERVTALLCDPAVRQAVAIVIGLRVSLGVVAWASMTLHAPTFELGDFRQYMLPQTARLWPIVGPWQRWDALQFEHLASAGYRSGSTDAAYLPLYPGLMHVSGALLGGAYALGGLLVSTVAFTVGLVLLHRLVSADFDRPTADRTVLYLAILPTAFFFLAPYSESLFLALALGMFVAARRRRFLIAGVLAAAASLTRIQGILLVLPLMIEMAADAAARHRSGGRWWSRDHLAVGLPVLALAGWLAYVRWGLHVPGGPWQAERSFNGHRLATPWQIYTDALNVIRFGTHADEVLNVVALVVLLQAIPFMFGRLRWSYIAWAVVAVLPSLVQEASVSPLMSAARYATVAFPLAVVLALEGKRSWVDRLVTVLLPPIGALLLYEYVHFGFVG